MTVRRKIAAVVGAILAGLLVLFGLALVVLHAPPARQFLLEQLISILADRDVDFAAGGIEYNLIEGTATLRDVRVSAADAQDLGVLLRARRISATISLRQLIRGVYFIKAATVENPEIHVVIAENGRHNIPTLRQSGGDSRTGIALVFDQLTLTGGSLRFEDRRQHIDVVLPAWHISVDGDLSSRIHDVRLGLDRPGFASLDDQRLPIRALNAQLSAGPQAIRVGELRVAAGESVISASGTIRDLNDPRVEARLAADLSLDTMARFAGARQEIEGAVHVDVTASGRLSALQITTSLNGQDLRLDRFRDVDIAATVTYALNAGRVRIDTFSVSSPVVNASGEASLALTTQAGRSSMNISLKALDVERAGVLYDLPVRVASRVSGKLEGSFPGLNLRAIQARSQFQLVPTLGAVAKNTIPVAGRVRAEVRGLRMDARVESIEAAGVSARGDVLITEDKRLEGGLRATVAIEQTLAAFSRYRGQEPDPRPAAAGQVEIAADLSGTTSRPAFEATARSSAIEAGGLKQIALNASVGYTPAQVTVREASIRWQEQTARASGTIGLQGDQPTDLRLRAEALSLSTILAGAGRKDLSASGTFSLTADLGGAFRRPRGQVLLTGTDLSMLKQPLGSLRAEASINEQVVRLDALRLDKAPRQALTASGSYDLESSAFSFRANADRLELRQIVLPDGSAAEANFDFSADVKGTREDPRGSIELQASDIRYKGEDLGAIAGNVKLADRAAVFDLRAPKYAVTARGTVGVDAPYTAKLGLVADRIELASLPIAQDQPLRGTVSATFDATGPLSIPEQLTAAGRVAFDLTWRDQPIRTPDPITVRYSGALLTIEQGAVEAAGSKLAISGSIPLQPSAPQGTISLDGTLDLGGLAGLAPKAGYKANGTAKLSGVLRGSLSRIDPQITLTTQNAAVTIPGFNPVTNIDFNLRIENGAAKEDLTATWAGARIQSSGTIPLGLLPQRLPVEWLRKGGPADFTLDVNNLQFAAIRPIPSDVAGTVSLRLEARSSAPRLEAIEGKLRFTQLEMKVGDIGFQQAGTSTLALRNGAVMVEHLQLSGPQTRVQVAGSAGLADPHRLNLQAAGELDAALVAAFSDAVRAQGPIELSLDISGNAADPQVAGFMTMTDVTLGMSEPRVAADGLNGRIRFQGARATIENLNANLNGGKLDGRGSFSLAKAALQDVALAFKLDGVYFDYPDGFQTLSDGDITFRSVADRQVLGGKVAVIEGSYTEPLTLDRGLLGYIASDQPGLNLTRERSPILEKMQFDLAIETRNPLVVDNNLAQLGINSNLRLTGSFYRPGLVGRITLEEGGELYLSERTYLVERGMLTFTNERRIDPSLDILARTEVDQYDISLLIQGGGGERMQTTLTSDPALPEPDIMALLLTGQKLEAVRGSEVEVAGRQALSLLTGSLTGRLGQTLKRATGLSQVRVEPNLIAAEEDPTARLTLGQDITRNLSFVYSMDLTNSSDQVYIAEYDLARRFSTRGIKQEDDSYRFEFRHDLAFGENGVSEERDRDRRQRTIESIDFSGETPIPRERLRDEFDLKAGDRYDFFKVRNELDDLRQLHAEEDLLEARVRLDRREQGQDRIALTIRTEAGPQIEFVYEGWDVPDRDQKRVRRIWQAGVFDAQRTADASSAIRGALVDRGFLRPQVEASVAAERPGHKRVLVEIQPGIRYGGVRLVFEGAQGIEPDDLKKAIEKAGLERRVYTDPEKVTDALIRYYRGLGYLDASIDPPRYELNAATRSGQVVFPVKEGPRYRVGSIGFAGNRALTEGQIREELHLRAGDPYTPAASEQALDQIRAAYETHGYLDTSVEAALGKNAETARVNLTFQIAENRKSQVKTIEVDGNVNTSDNLVQTQLKLKPGDPLTPSALGQSRRNLYRTEAFQTVDIERKVLNPDAANETKNIALNVNVREVKPFQVRYGGYFDTERGPGGVVDFANRNLLGAARLIGASVRYDRDLRDARVYFGQPLLERIPLKTTATTFARREIFETFTTTRIGFSAQQETRFGDHFVLNYGYRLARTHTVDRDPEAIIPFDIRLRVAPLTSSLTRETRDDFLDATRGSFSSHSLEWATATLGSQLRFIRYFGQYFRYIPLSEPVEAPWRGGYRSRWVYAGGVRVGLAGGLGGMVLPPSERFFAGGGTSIRGFQQNRLGPLDGAGQPLGGNAMLVINNEVRWPLWWIFDGVGFFDLGNVYPHASDFSITEIRKAGGIGLRARTPYFLLRLDYGVKFDRHPGESRGQIFFSIGQAF